MTQVVDLKPLPLAHRQRIHGLHLPDAAVGVGPVGAFGGYVLLPVMNERGLFWKLAPSGLTRWALLPGRPGVGKVVETGWMGRVRNWIETRFRGMVRSLGLHRIEARSYWGLVARVNLILLVHNLIRSRVLLKMAGVES